MTSFFIIAGSILLQIFVCMEVKGYNNDRNLSKELIIIKRFLYLIITFFILLSIQEWNASAVDYTNQLKMLLVDEIRAQIPIKCINHKTIDDFNVQSGWIWGKESNINGENARTAVSRNAVFDHMKKDYGSTIGIKQYFAATIDIDDVSKLDTVQFSLKSNVNDNTNQFIYTLDISTLNSGVNNVYFNKIDAVKTGDIKWSDVRAIGVACRSKASSTVHLKIARIETYDMPAMVSITFDDGTADQYTIAYNYMMNKNPAIPGCIALITDDIGKTGKLTKVQIGEMIAAGWDMQNHTKNHKNISLLSDQQTEYQIAKGVEALKALNAGEGAYHFVPPFYTVRAKTSLVKKYATMCKVLNQKEPLNKIPITNPYGIKTYEVYPDTSLSQLIALTDLARDNGLWLVTTMHKIGDVPAKGTMLTKDFKAYIDYIHKNRDLIRPVTFSEAMKLQ